MKKQINRCSTRRSTCFILWILLSINIIIAFFFSQKLVKLEGKHSSWDEQNVKVGENAIAKFVFRDKSAKVSEPEKRINEHKLILIWNNPQMTETAVFGVGHEPFVRQRCEVSKCSIHYNHSVFPLEKYDAIIVNIALIYSSELADFQRRQSQRFIFLAHESPDTMLLSFPDIVAMGNSFNWTMSYRRNSDIQYLYGRILPGPSAPKTRAETRKLIKATHRSSAKNYGQHKIKLISWMVTHCETSSLRETYVRQLNKFIPVDVYGKCGNLSCTRNNTHSYSDPKCYDMLEAKYKFYLSFENSICEDYVTEKFFEIMNHDIVPVVYGGANYSRIAPPHSYIDALQFTPETLAQYLKVLDANDQLYNEYFWWKGHYTVESGVEQMARHGFCDLCKKLHQDEGVVQFYPQLVSEWHPKRRCKHFDSWETQS